MAASAHQGGGSSESPPGPDLAAQNAQLRGCLGDCLHALAQLLEAPGRAGMTDGDLSDAVAFARAEHARLRSALRVAQRAGGAV